jgi:hypothetical protein
MEDFQIEMEDYQIKTEDYQCLFCNRPNPCQSEAKNDGRFGQ